MTAKAESTAVVLVPGGTGPDPAIMVRVHSEWVIPRALVYYDTIEIGDSWIFYEGPDTDGRDLVKISEPADKIFVRFGNELLPIMSVADAHDRCKNRVLPIQVTESDPICTTFRIIGKLYLEAHVTIARVGAVFVVNIPLLPGHYRAAPDSDRRLEHDRRENSSRGDDAGAIEMMIGEEGTAYVRSSTPRRNESPGRREAPYADDQDVIPTNRMVAPDDSEAPPIQKDAVH